MEPAHHQPLVGVEERSTEREGEEVAAVKAAEQKEKRMNSSPVFTAVVFAVCLPSLIQRKGAQTEPYSTSDH